MKTKTLLIIASVLILNTWIATAQHKIVKHDTTITERIDYAPDTIAVWFKEIKIESSGDKILKEYNGRMWERYDSVVTEQWTKGYVIWQTMKRGYTGTATSVNYGNGQYIGGGSIATRSIPDSFYKDPYQPTRFLTDTFLYADKKTKVTNKVLYTILR